MDLAAVKVGDFRRIGLLEILSSPTVKYGHRAGLVHETPGLRFTSYIRSGRAFVRSGTLRSTQASLLQSGSVQKPDLDKDLSRPQPKLPELH
jgi:hypothetical protein